MAFHREGHYRHFEEYQTAAALALCPWSQAANVRFASKAEITRDQLQGISSVSALSPKRTLTERVAKVHRKEKLGDG